MSILRSHDPDLRDLAQGEPALTDVVGRYTGAHLMRLLGVGGMSTVFLADIGRARFSTALNDVCPGRIAVKIMKPSMVTDLAQEGISAGQLAQREALALGRIMSRMPPTEFVVGFYGASEVAVEVRGRQLSLPWLAIEYVDGGPDGSSLAERVNRAPEGMDPIRALRFCRGIVQGVSALHEVGIIHRDLKPDNVLVVGPVGDETPKIADCGISRVDGATYTIAALTREYAGTEQWLSRPGEKNPLVGPWTDVHALAAVIWFILGGEHWCRGAWDNGFLVLGQRRSLKTASRLHPGFAADQELLDEIDRVLFRGGSPALPEDLRDNPSATALAPRDAPPRFGSVEAFANRLFPLLERIASRWKMRAAREDRAAFCSTRLAGEPLLTLEPLAQIVDLPPIETKGMLLPPIRPGNVAFHADGRALVRRGGHLFHVSDLSMGPVQAKPDEAEVFAATTHVVRGPVSGFALVGPAHVRLVRPGQIIPIQLPDRKTPIEAALGDGFMFGVVTGATPGDEDSLPELWALTANETWAPPVPLPLGGRVLAMSSGPYGLLVVGANVKGTRARALFMSHDGQTAVYAAGVTDKPPLHAALAGMDRTSWAAGEGFVLRLDRGLVTVEDVEAKDRPVVMGFDPVGLPWLVTGTRVLRRHADDKNPVWRLYYELDPNAPHFVAIAFSGDGVRVMDARGGGVRITPRDVGGWRSTSLVLDAR
jgi:eukaryotic-like serine/threonine-protein kinase